MRFFDKGTNMNRLWDSDMIEHEGGREEFWLADFAAPDTPENRGINARSGSVHDHEVSAVPGDETFYHALSEVAAGPIAVTSHWDAHVQTIAAHPSGWMNAAADHEEPDRRGSVQRDAIRTAAIACAASDGTRWPIRSESIG